MVAGADIALPAPRVFLGYLGIGLIGASLVPELGAAFPILVAAVLAVAASPAGPAATAWAVSSQGRAGSWAAPVVLIIIGALCRVIALRRGR